MLIEYLALLYFCVILVFIPTLGSFKLSASIDDNRFKRIRIKKFKFLFKAIAFQDIEKHGIIIPMFILQLSSYFLSILMLIIGLVMISNGKNIVTFLFIMLLIEGLAFASVVIILSIISKQREEHGIYVKQRRRINNKKTNKGDGLEKHDQQ